MSAPSHFQAWFDEDASIGLMHERQQFPTPEHINDNPLTAPSRRILNYCAEYEKPLHGSLIAMAIGLDTIRQECLLFNQWLQKLSDLTPLA